MTELEQVKNLTDLDTKEIFYETPSGLCTMALKRWKADFGLSSDYGYVGLDAGSGNGVWGKSF